MQHLEGSGTPVLYIGRTVLKGGRFIMYSGITNIYYKKTRMTHIYKTCTDRRNNSKICFSQ